MWQLNRLDENKKKWYMHDLITKEASFCVNQEINFWGILNWGFEIH